MKILLVTIEPPLPFSTAASKWFYLLFTELLKRGHEVTCFSVCSKPKDMEEARRLFPKTEQLRLYSFPLEKSIKRKIKSLWEPYSYMFSSSFKRDISAELENNYDVIHVEQLWAGWVIPPSFIHKSLINIHHLVTIDLEETKKSKVRDLYEYFQTVRAEKKLVRKFKFRRFFTDRLLHKSQTFADLNQGKSEVIPFSVDIDLYHENLGHETTPLSVGMIASMGWYPGRSAALNLLTEIYPAIQLKRPDCELKLAGWNARKELSSFIGQNKVHILENIPDVEDFFKSLTVFVYIPSRGSGMKIKVIEAMLYGIPVVTTREGLEGLPAEHCEHALIVESNAEAAQGALRLLDDPGLRRKLSQNARKMVTLHCHRDTVMEKVESLYQSIIQK